MAGVINYYHGEFGTVVDRGYVLDQPDMPRTYALRLRNDPHHELAYDYGSDIAIDPLLEAGDKAVYVRLDTYSGIWVREQDQFYPGLQRAIGRAMGERSGDWTEPRIFGETRRKPDETPSTEASFFLSFSSRNVMLARQIFEDLKRDAKVEVWFDLDQEGESPEHKRWIESWLREALYNSRGFILLWTEAAGKSRWVRKEIEWASEKASNDPNFHFVVLKLDEKPIPTDLDTRYLVDCRDLWPTHGVKEELFAAVTGRNGRIAWVEEHRRRGIELEDEENPFPDPKYGYEPFRSDSGVAISLRHWEEDGEFCWQLEYQQGQRFYNVSGRGRDEIVDLGIRTGDDVGFFIYNYRPLWMRSADLRLRPSDVFVDYMQKVAA